MPFAVLLCVCIVLLDRSTPLLLPAALRQTRLLSCDSTPNFDNLPNLGFHSGSLICDSTIAHCNPMIRRRLSGSCPRCDCLRKSCTNRCKAEKDNKAVSGLRLHGEPCLANKTAARTCHESLQNECPLQLCSTLLLLPLIHDLSLPSPRFTSLTNSMTEISR